LHPCPNTFLVVHLTLFGPYLLDVRAGGSVTLASRAYGVPAPSHRWLHDGNLLDTSDRHVKGADTATLTLVDTLPG